MNPIKTLDDLKDYGTYECRGFRRNLINRFPELERYLIERYIDIAETESYVHANRWLCAIDSHMIMAETTLSCIENDETYIDWADEVSKTCLRHTSQISHKNGVAFGQAICERYGVDWPVDGKVTEAKEKTALKKLSNQQWWLRKIRVKATRHFEEWARSNCFVQSRRAVYCSNLTYSRRQYQMQRNNRLLQSLIATNEEGEALTLADVAESGQANPTNRRNELMVRFRGYDELAKSANLQGLAITLTCPSRFHAIHKRSGQTNQKFDGSSPIDAQQYLCKVWAKVRAEWQRQGIKTFGFRIAEPHHDGTPHWHLALYFSPEQAEQAQDILIHHAVMEDKEELKGDYKKRIDVMKIEPSKGSLIGYFSKYISKNIDGQKLDNSSIGDDYESGMNALDSATRVQAWATCWGIRQFQQIGSVSVTVWRELRRLTSQSDEPIEDEQLNAIAAACDDGDWSRFVELMGGAFVKRDQQPIRPYNEKSDNPGRYGQEVERIKGVIMNGVKKIITRIHEWVVTQTEHQHDPNTGLQANTLTQISFAT